jgi:hypothetical protein
MKKISIIIFLIFSKYAFNQDHSLSIEKTKFTKEFILNALYSGDLQKESDMIKWKPDLGSNALLSDDGYCYTMLDTIVLFKKDSIQMALAIFNTIQFIEGVGQSCNGCQPSELGIAVFKEMNKTWELMNFNYSIDRIGFSGLLPTPSIIEIGKSKYGLLLNQSDHSVSNVSNLGYLYSLDSITFSNKILSYVQNHAIDYKQQPLMLEGSIKVLKSKSEEDFYPISITYKKVKYINEKPKMINSKSVTYKFFDGSWVSDL